MARFCFTLLLILLPLAVFAGPDGRVRVIDADTWDVGGKRVRLHGIDAPEADQTCQRASGVVWPCGQWATEQARDRFENRHATCTALDTDRYGRTVARCTVGAQDAGRVLVSEGIAFAYRRYAMDYDLDEKGAVVNGSGLHGSEVQRPSAYRATKRGVVQPSRQDCPIKGNVSSKGVRIYHMPGQEHYARTRISPSKGERWFCTQAEAQAAGWRRARR